MAGPLIFLVVVTAVFVAVIAYAIQVEKKRKAAIEAAAAELGLRCQPHLTDHDRGMLHTFALGQAGSSRAAQLATVADSGELRLVVFDYQYTVGSGKNKQTRAYSVAMVISQELDLPQFELAPENFFHRWASWLGMQDIDFDDDPEFSRRFRLQAKEEAAVRDFFTRPRRETLTRMGAVHVQARGRCFISFRPGKQQDGTHLRKLMEEGFALYSIFRSPRHADSLS